MIGTAVGRADRRRDVGLGQAGHVVDADGLAAVRVDHVRADDRRQRRRAQVGDLDRRGHRAGVLDQVEQVEAAVRGALGQEPRGGRAGQHAALRMAAVAADAPRHRAIRDHLDVRFDERRERRARHRGQVVHVDRQPAERQHRARIRHDGAIVLLVAGQHVGGNRRGVGQGDARIEERPGRALGEIRDHEAARVRPLRQLLEVGAAVPVRIAAGAVDAGAGVRIEAVARLPVVRQRVVVGVARVHAGRVRRGGGGVVRQHGVEGRRRHHGRVDQRRAHTGGDRRGDRHRRRPEAGDGRERDGAVVARSAAHAAGVRDAGGERHARRQRIRQRHVERRIDWTDCRSSACRSPCCSSSRAPATRSW